jgi:hypothetical protein
MSYLFNVGDSVKWVEDGKEHKGVVRYRGAYYWGNGYGVKPSRSPRSLVVIVKESELSMTSEDAPK